MKSRYRTSAIALGVIFAAGLCLFFAMRRSPGLYRVTILPSPEGGGMAALGINDRGQVIGVVETRHGTSHLFLWDRRQGMQDLGYAHVPYYINNAGQIAGTILDPNAHRQTAIWEAGNGWMPLGTLGGVKTSYAGGINDRGQVVGTAQMAYGHWHAFLWDKSGGMRDLGTLGGRDSQARAINDAGEVFGLSDTPLAENQPFLWDPNTGMTAIGPQSSDTRLSGLNNNSWIVGAAENSQPSRRLIVWNRKAGVRDLCPLDRALCEPALLNDANQIVFREMPDDSSSGIRNRFFTPRAPTYLWDPNHGKILLDPHIPLKRGEYFWPTDINNKGAIVGILGSGPTISDRRAILLEPIPERWPPRTGRPRQPSN